MGYFHFFLLLQCSESCARGLKTRSVKCYKNGQEIADDKCIPGDRPKSQEYCVIKPCRSDISTCSLYFTTLLNFCLTPNVFHSIRKSIKMIHLLILHSLILQCLEMAPNLHASCFTG